MLWIKHINGHDIETDSSPVKCAKCRTVDECQTIDRLNGGIALSRVLMWWWWCNETAAAGQRAELWVNFGWCSRSSHGKKIATLLHSYLILPEMPVSPHAYLSRTKRKKHDERVASRHRHRAASDWMYAARQFACLAFLLPQFQFLTLNWCKKEKRPCEEVK